MYALDLDTAHWRKSSRSSANANCVEVAFFSRDWRKSTRSSSNANCVEVAWRKSTRSTDTANCVEVAFAGPAVGLRDSKNTAGPVLAFPADTWALFLRAT